MATPNASFETLRGEGFTGSLSDMRRQNLLTLLSLTEPQGTNNDLELRYWRAQGKTSSILDARHAVRINLALNPGYESGTDSFQSSNVTLFVLSSDTVAPITGTTSALATRTVSALNTSVGQVLGNIGATGVKIPVTEGQYLTCGMSVKTDQANASINTRFFWFDAVSAQTSSIAKTPFTGITAGQVYRVTDKAVVPAGIVGAYFVVTIAMGTGNVVGGEKMWADLLTIENRNTDGSWF